METKRFEFQASISDVTPINPLFSTCKVRVLYTGKNPNKSIITKEAVEKALPTLKNIPIVGEFSVENNDFKGHGGSIDLDTYKYIHTTKPYGVVPESATYQWENVTDKDGVTHEYLTIYGCYLWTGRYEEAQSVIDNGKGQSMEIEVIDGQWLPEENAYRIDDFVFSALCILGDNVKPAFSEASITAYSLDRDSFKKEFSQMLKELKFSLSKEKEVETMGELVEKEVKTKKAEEKFSRTFELSHSDIRSKLYVLLDSYVKENGIVEEPEDTYYIVDVYSDNVIICVVDYSDPMENEFYRIEYELENDVITLEDFDQVYPMYVTSQEQNLIETLRAQQEALEVENNELKAFKLKVEKANHEAKAREIFARFQLKDEDVEGIDIHSLSLQDIEEKCYAILGRKMAKKNFSLANKEKDGGIRLPIGSGDHQDKQVNKPYGDLFDKYKK